MFKKLNDPVSSLSHLCGAILSVPTTIALLIVSVANGYIWYIVPFLIFGVSLFALYTASTVYHLIPKDEPAKITKLKARRIDHMMIYVLIAGTYTPICLISIKGVWGYSIVAIIWTLAIFGIVFKMFVLNDSKIIRYISTSIYLFMGWLVIVAIIPLIRSVDTDTLILLILGGVSYSVGAVIYALKKPNIPVDWLSFHDIFHFFVLLGSAFHVFTMFTII